LPIERRFVPEDGRYVTQCAATARQNAKRAFNLDMPHGNMFVATREYQSGKCAAISGYRAFEEFSSQTIPNLASHQDVNVVDIMITSRGKNAKYGHRAMGFRKGSEWFVLDPYRTGNQVSPIPFDEYHKKISQSQGTKIVGMAYYQSEKKVV